MNEKALKNKKIAMVVAPVVCIIAAISIIITSVIIPNSNYSAAVELMESGKYYEAAAAFEEMGGYKDSAEQAKECLYLVAVEYLGTEDYAEAADIFTELGDYKNSALLLENGESWAANYTRGIALMEKESYVAAIGAFIDAEDYKDAFEMIKECKYRMATDYLEIEDWRAARKYFNEVPDYKDSAEILEEIKDK